MGEAGECDVWPMVAMAVSVTAIFLDSIGTRPSLLFQAISSVGRQAREEAAEAGHDNQKAAAR